MTLLSIAGITVFILILMLGLILTVFGLPGNLLIFLAALVYGLVTGFSPLGLKVLITLLVMAILAEGLEFALGMAGAHHLGVSKQGLAASVIGCIIGAFLLTPFLYGLGTLLGFFIGSFSGVWIVEIIRQQRLKAAFRAATGAIMGRAAGSLVKGVLTIGMIATTLITIYS